MKPNYACLIPYTRPDVVQTSIDAAKADGYTVLTYQDVNLNGANKSREVLLNRAFADESITHIRYADDDDILLPHLEVINEAFSSDPSLDVIYCDANMVMPSGIVHPLKYSGNPLNDTMNVHPWVWIAKKRILADIKRVYGYLWDYDRPCREGGYAWIKLLQSGCNIKHLEVIAYQYNKSFSPDCISQHPEFAKETKRLARILEEYTQQ